MDLCKTILGIRLKVGSAAVCYENFPFSPAFPLKGCTQVLFFREKPFLPPQLWVPKAKKDYWGVFTLIWNLHPAFARFHAITWTDLCVRKVLGNAMKMDCSIYGESNMSVNAHYIQQYMSPSFPRTVPAQVKSDRLLFSTFPDPMKRAVTLGAELMTSPSLSSPTKETWNGIEQNEYGTMFGMKYSSLV